MPSSSHQPTSASAQPSESIPTLIDFMYSIPSPVTTELVALSPYISCIRQALEITSWRSHWTESWLALAAWWAVCLLAYPGLRYFLPILLVSAAVFKRWRPSYFSRSSPLITEKNLQHTISDLATIHALVPHPFVPSTAPIPFITLLRIALLSYPPYLLLNYFVSLRVLLGVSGTIVLTCRAPWSQTTRHILWESAYIRWSFYHISSYITGHPLPSKTLSTQAHQGTSSASDGPVNSVRFLFTIYENQRWWMGLDWTAALLPAERPSWCSAAQLPVSPPNAFSLPAPTVSYLPADTKDKDGKPDKRVKRTARWSWEEGEWRVMIRKDGMGGVSRVERPLPSDDNTSGQSSGAASRIFKGVGKRRESSDSTGGVGAGSGGKAVGEGDEEPFEGGDEEDGLVVTDPDGWVYGDNKWEGGSAKGGLGKYTRYRRWTRIAVLTETIEIVDAGDSGVFHIDTDDGLAKSQNDTNPTLPPTPTSITYSKQDHISGSPTSPTRSQESQSPTRGMLRQRLKAAVDGAQS